MGKFKIGDKVRQLGSGSNTSSRDNGKEAVVKEVGGRYSSNNDGIKIDNTNFYWKPTDFRGEAGFELVTSFSIRQRIEALNNGWDKEADDILDEICGEKTIDIKIERDIGGKTGFGVVKADGRIWGRDIKSFSFNSQCGKNKAFKDLLLCIAEEVGLLGVSEGDSAEVSIDGTKWEAKLVRKL